MKLTRSLIVVALSFVPAMAFAHGAHGEGITGVYHAIVHMLLSQPLLIALIVVIPICAYWFLKNLNR